MADLTTKQVREDRVIQVHHGDALEVLRTLPGGAADCCVTSPPYWGLRDYGVDGQLGLEPTPEEYVAKLVEVFREVRRVLRDDGTLWLNLGDCYARSPKKGIKFEAKSARTYLTNRQADEGNRGHAVPPGLKPKDLVGIPWRVAFALQADGWWLRSDIIWAKPNPMPESVRDRPTKAHEYVFLLAKSERYFLDQDAVREPSDGPWNAAKGFGSKLKKSAGVSFLRTQGHGSYHDDEEKMGRNVRSVWTITTEPFPEAHFAVMPTALAERCIKAGCPLKGTVLDPFAGAGTTGLVADRLGRSFVGIELNPDYVKMAKARITKVVRSE